jgi:hypothetical protein
MPASIGKYTIPLNRCKHSLTLVSPHSMKLNKIPLADTPAFSPSREAAWLGYKHTIPQHLEGVLNEAIKQKPLGGSGGEGRKFRHVEDKEDHERFWAQMIQDIEAVEEEAGLSTRMIKKGGHGVPLSGQYPLG